MKCFDAIMGFTKFATLVAVAMWLAGCAWMDRMTVDMTGKVIAKGAVSFYDENDLELARDAAAANVKLLDALLVTSPMNKELLVLAAQSYGGYAFGFLEDDMLRLKALDNEEADALYEAKRKRAQNLYRRARMYAERVILDSYPEYSAALEGQVDRLEAVLDKMDEDDVPALFFTAFAWGGLINISRDDPMMAADLGKVEAIMQRVLELDETFFNAGPHLFFAIRYAGVSKELGGSAEKSKYHFQRVFELTYNKFLLARALYAQFYAPLVQDEELFDKTIADILARPLDTLPGQTLYTVMAKRRAAFLATRKDDFF